VLETELHAFHRPGRSFAEGWAFKTAVRVSVSQTEGPHPPKAVGNMHDRPLVPCEQGGQLILHGILDREST
jgi:hypothetical protein